MVGKNGVFSIFAQCHRGATIGESGSSTLALTIDGVGIRRIDVGECYIEFKFGFHRTHLRGYLGLEGVFFLGYEAVTTGNGGFQYFDIVKRLPDLFPACGDAMFDIHFHNIAYRV